MSALSSSAVIAIPSPCATKGPSLLAGFRPQAARTAAATTIDEMMRAMAEALLRVHPTRLSAWRRNLGAGFARFEGVARGDESRVTRPQVTFWRAALPAATARRRIAS